MAFNGFNRPTLKTIQERLIARANNNIPGVDVRYTPLNALVNAFAGALHEMYGLLTFGLEQTNLIECVNENLDKFGGNIWGISRLSPSFASGEVSFTGTGTVPVGTILQTSNGLQFRTTSSGIIAVEPGSKYNLASGTLLTFASPVTNVGSTASVLTLSGGADREPDDKYRARILARIANPPHSGNYNDYIVWAKENPGVTRAWCFPLVRGPGTVDVLFTMDDTYLNGIPLEQDILTIQAYMDSDDRRPVTSDVRVLAPIPLAIDVTIQNLTPDTSITRTNITNELTDLFINRSEPGVDFSINWIWDAISNADGVDRFSLVSPSSNLTFPTNNIPVLGTITYI